MFSFTHFLLATNDQCFSRSGSNFGLASARAGMVPACAWKISMSSRSVDHARFGLVVTQKYLRITVNLWRSVDAESSLNWQKRQDSSSPKRPITGPPDTFHRCSYSYLCRSSASNAESVAWTLQVRKAPLPRASLQHDVWGPRAQWSSVIWIIWLTNSHVDIICGPIWVSEGRIKVWSDAESSSEGVYLYNWILCFVNVSVFLLPATKKILHIYKYIEKYFGPPVRKLSLHFWLQDESVNFASSQPAGQKTPSI